jgi:hypothetical protein
MAEFKSFSPTAQVRGEVVAAFAAAFPREVEQIGIGILEKHGLSSPRPGDFYPLQEFLDAMKEIADRFSSQMLYRIGMQIATHAVLPPGIDDLQKALGAVDAAYRMNHRGGEIGKYQYNYLGTVEGLERGVMTCPNPYPCSFDRGVIEGFAKRFKPSGATDVVVRHDDSKPCRQKGLESCTYVITWM